MECRICFTIIFHQFSGERGELKTTKIIIWKEKEFTSLCSNKIHVLLLFSWNKISDSVKIFPPSTGA